MSVYMDHLSIKTKKNNYQAAFEFFRKLLPEEIFIHGEELESNSPWAGFFLYFDGGFFLEFPNPDICLKSKSLGLSFTCVKDFRESFLDVMVANATSKFERISMPEVDPMVELCATDEGDFLSTRASVYSDQWYKDWGAEISKLCLLSPFGKINKIMICTTPELEDEIKKNFAWIDPEIANAGEKFIPISGGECSFYMDFNSKHSQRSIVLEFEVEEAMDVNMKDESFEFEIKNKLGMMRVNL